MQHLIGADVAMGAGWAGLAALVDGGAGGVVPGVDGGGFGQEGVRSGRPAVVE